MPSAMGAPAPLPPTPLARCCRDHGEAIEVLALPVASIASFLRDESLGKSAGLLFSVMWLRERLEAQGGRLLP